MRNWAGNVSYAARRRIEPASLDELRQAVRAASSFRVLGWRHAFNTIADTEGDHISLTAMPRIVEIDAPARVVSVDGAIRYGDLCPALDAAGLALPNLASLPHIGVAGACVTATHGSGERLGTLATAVSAIELLRSDGGTVEVSRSADPEVFAGAVVSLGALGVVTRLTLDLEPAYRVAQRVYDDLPIAAIPEHLDAILGAARSVSLFTTWQRDAVDQVWVKQRVPGEPADPAADTAASAEAAASLPDLFGATPAPVQRHPIPGLPPAACTPQLGVPGSWHDRLPHFRLDHTPSAGDELQAEYFVDRRDGVAAFAALHAMRDRLAPLVLVTEIRTVAADEHWLSPAYRRESIAFHFTLRRDWPAVRELLPRIEAALEPFAPRPHWAKLFTASPDAVRSRYPRLGDFAALAAELDAAGKLRNAFLDRYVLG